MLAGDSLKALEVWRLFLGPWIDWTKSLNVLEKSLNFIFIERWVYPKYTCFDCTHASAILSVVRRIDYGRQSEVVDDDDDDYGSYSGSYGYGGYGATGYNKYEEEEEEEEEEDEEEEDEEEEDEEEEDKQEEDEKDCSNEGEKEPSKEDGEITSMHESMGQVSI